MTIAVVQAASAAASGGLTVPALTFGSPVTTNNLLVAAVFAAANNMSQTFPVAGSNGWTLQAESATLVSKGNVAWYTRTALVGDGTSPPSPPNNSNYNSFDCSIIMWEVSGALGSPKDVADAEATSNQAASPTVSVTAGGNGELALIAIQQFFCTALAISGGSPGAWSTDTSGTEGAIGNQRWIGAHQAVASGNTVDATVTGTSSNASLSYVTILLKAAAGSETSTASLALSKVSFGATAAKYHEGGPATLALSGVSIKANVVDVTAEPVLVNFFTF